MLPRGHRLHAERDILRLLRTGARKRDVNLQLVAALSPVGVSRAAVVVSKQVAKHATVRNRIRRQVQADLPALLAATNPATDVLVRVNPGAHRASHAQLRHSLTTLWPTHGVPAQSRPTRRPHHPARVPTHPLARP